MMVLLGRRGVGGLHAGALELEQCGCVSMWPCQRALTPYGLCFQTTAPTRSAVRAALKAAKDLRSIGVQHPTVFIISMYNKQVRSTGGLWGHTLVCPNQLGQQQMRAPGGTVCCPLLPQPVPCCAARPDHAACADLQARSKAAG